MWLNKMEYTKKSIQEDFRRTYLHIKRLEGSISETRMDEGLSPRLAEVINSAYKLCIEQLREIEWSQLNQIINPC